MFSLQSLCLDLIVKIFHVYNFAFTVSKDESLQRNLRFLQRRFSNHLTNKLFDCILFGEIPINEISIDECFDFLINEHLTTVDISWFRSSRYLKSVDDIFRRLPNLRKLRIYFDFYGEPDTILESVAKFCPKIVKIDANHSSVTDKGIKYLCETKNGKLPCPELKKIRLESTGITQEGAEYLIRSLPEIEKFIYPDLPLVLHFIHTNNSSEHRKVCFNLTKLDVTCKGPADVLKSCLTVCPKLESVCCCLSGEEDLNALPNLQKLASLDVQANSSINIDAFVKTNGRNLIYLDISGCTVSASALSIHCPALKTLHLRKVDFTDDGDLNSIFPSLIKCTFIYKDNSALKKAFRLLSSSSPNLKSVSFSRCPLSRELRSQIIIWCTSPCINDISFFSMHLEINFLTDLFENCPTLKEIELNLCTYDVHNPEEVLDALVEKHPNKPITEYF